jgi:galactokinase
LLLSRCLHVLDERIHPEESRLSEAIDAAVAAFRREYGAEPTHVARAPGRVNLIGEHIDYNGLSVLPMALQREVAVALRPRSDAHVRIGSTTHGERAFDLATDIEPYGTGDWGNYAKAAAQALVCEVGLRTGIDATIHSTVPAAAGLSSSSALVIGIAVALLTGTGAEPDGRDDADGGWGLPVSRLALAEMMARAERYTGTHGGGMDQAISVCGRAGAAVRVDFRPLRVTPVPVPDSWRFVIADSGVRAEKSGAAQATYNLRTRECAEALEHVVAYLGEPADTDYRALIERHTVDALVEAGDAALEDPVRRRFRHVVTEAARVRDAQAALHASDAVAFGALMDASHASLRDDYEVSRIELDAMVEVARSAGAAGARLTGAGMGGCIVALVEESGVADVAAALGAIGDPPIIGVASAGASAMRIAPA